MTTVRGNPTLLLFVVVRDLHDLVPWTEAPAKPLDAEGYKPLDH
jgi:hypothetical protein